MRIRSAIAGISFVFTVACGERTPLDPAPLPRPAFDVIATCELGVSTEDALATIDALLDEIDALQLAGTFSAVKARALRTQLTGIKRALVRGQVCPAVAQLDAFRDQVMDLIADGTLSPEEAAPLLDGVREVLGEPPVARFAQIAAGGVHSCGLTATGRAYCWGLNLTGQLGDGTTDDRLTPVPVVGDHVFVALAAGTEHTCGLTPSGAAFCWGDNEAGTIGDGAVGTEFSRLVPTAVIGGIEFTTINAGLGHTCGLTAAGAAYCWGFNLQGQVGDGTNERARPAPTPVNAGGVTFAAVSAGFVHSCGVSTTGTAYCWGANSFGALGDGTTSFSRPTPGPVLGGESFVTIRPAGSFTCALGVSSLAWCWGYNGEGELGDGTFDHRSLPVVAGGMAFDFLDTGDFHSCGVDESGAAHCWGRGTEGQIGDGARENRPAPVPIWDGNPFRDISGGNTHGCGLAIDNAAYCWGFNGAGQLGDGTTEDRVTPTAVRGPIGS